MKSIILKSHEINNVRGIQKKLLKSTELESEEYQILYKFVQKMLSLHKRISTVPGIEFLLFPKIWRTGAAKSELEKWRKLFENIPGFDNVPCSIIITEKDLDFGFDNIVITASFAPTLAYNLVTDNEPYEVLLHDDGSASFWLTKAKEKKRYPALQAFKGSWKEAYLLLIETLKKGWPMEEFPDELKPFLKK